MIIRNGQVALPGAEDLRAVDIRVERGQIVEIGERLGGGEIVDAQGLVILPGGIDPHVHFDDPGYTDREDFSHGSRAAAAGGITTVIDMPCTSVPPVTNRRHLLHKLEAIALKSVVDFGLYAGVSAQSFQEAESRDMEDLAGDVLGFKTYFISGMASFGRLDHYQFERVLARAKELGLPVLLHAEDYDYVSAATAAWAQEGDRPWHYYRSRPEIAEMLAVRAAVELAQETCADLHVVHVGTAAAAEILAQGGASCETAPHYLAFDVDDFERIGAPLKVTPPVKSAGNKARLWARLAEGTIDFVASDHAPCPAPEKAAGSIWTAYSGIPGSGTLLPFMFSEGYMKGRLSLQGLLQVTSGGAARRYGLWSQKGSIEAGKDADLAWIDPQQSWVVEGSRSYSMGKITPFEGMSLQGRVVKTMLRGQVIYDVEKGIRVPGGYGRMLRRRA
jgi:allantoinase